MTNEQLEAKGLWSTRGGGSLPLPGASPSAVLLAVIRTRAVAARVFFFASVSVCFLVLQ